MGDFKCGECIARFICKTSKYEEPCVSFRQALSALATRPAQEGEGVLEGIQRYTFGGRPADNVSGADYVLYADILSRLSPAPAPVEAMHKEPGKQGEVEKELEYVCSWVAGQRDRAENTGLDGQKYAYKHVIGYIIEEIEKITGMNYDDWFSGRKLRKGE